MDNQEISRLKARGKAELLAFVLFLTLLGGAAAEYRRETAPLATAAVVFERGKVSRAAESRRETVQPAAAEADKKAEISAAETTVNSAEITGSKVTTIGTETAAMEARAPVSVLSAPAAEEIAARAENGQNVSGGSQAVQEAEQAEISGEALTEFLDFMQETKEKVDAVSKPESALAKISQPETAVKPASRSETVVFEEGKIEIYDSEKGVVAIEETAGENAVPADSGAKASSNGGAAGAVENQAEGTDKAVSGGETAGAEMSRSSAGETAGAVEQRSSADVGEVAGAAENQVEGADKAVSDGETAGAEMSRSSAGEIAGAVEQRSSASAGEVASAVETKGVNDVEEPVLLIPGQKDGESAETTENQTQPTVTAQKNISSETPVSAGGEAVDMMKDIATRQQEADSAQK